jgi:hypothetical protein
LSTKGEKTGFFVVGRCYARIWKFRTHRHVPLTKLRLCAKIHVTSSNGSGVMPKKDRDNKYKSNAISHSTNGLKSARNKCVSLDEILIAVLKYLYLSKILAGGGESVNSGLFHNSISCVRQLTFDVIFEYG